MAQSWKLSDGTERDTLLVPLLKAKRETETEAGHSQIYKFFCPAFEGADNSSADGKQHPESLIDGWRCSACDDEETERQR